MTVCDLKSGDRAVVLKVELSEEMQARLRYLNVYKGANVSVLKISQIGRAHV